MKKFLRVFLILVIFVMVILIGGALTVFFRPELLINHKTIQFALKKSALFKTWSYKDLSFNHEFIRWNKRHFWGSVREFCFEKENETKKIDACFTELSWNVELEWSQKGGLSYHVYRPLTIKSDKLVITTKAYDDSPPPDYFKLWDRLWTKLIPEVQMNLSSIDLIDLEKKKTHFSLVLHKDEKELNAEAFDFKLSATKERFVIFAPRPVRLPMDLKTKKPLYFKELKLVGPVNRNDIPIKLTGKIDTADLLLSTTLKKDWTGRNLPQHQVLKNILLGIKGEVVVDKIRQSLGRLMKPPFNQMPAPFNAMEGSLVVSLSAVEADRSEDVKMQVRSDVDMKGAGQFLKFHLDSLFDFDTLMKKPGLFVLGIEFEKVLLKLPRLEKNKMPPQLKPDPRFYRASELKKEKIIAKKNKNKREDPSSDLSLKIQAPADNPLQIKTNILDEILKMTFDLNFEEGKIKNGFIQTLPLQTDIFRRKVTVKSVRLNFHDPIETDIVAIFDFVLPEYVITLNLEGPLSKPRTAFHSKPPLPEDDIIAVLLFGRPMEDLDAEDKTASKTTGQILSQGILSLSVLYFFAGSPIQSIGYDPDTKEVSAQVALGKRNSLRVSSEGKGKSGAGLRHSLGKGWYIDSTVQKAGGLGNDYGVLLERIISY